MNKTFLAIGMLTIAQIIFWLKGNSKILWDVQWSPLRWWLTTSLLTNYLALHAWWMIIEKHGVWKAGVFWGVVAVIVDCILNCIFFEFNLRGVLALILIGVAALLV